MFGRAALGRRLARLRDVWKAPGVWTRRTRLAAVSLTSFAVGLFGL